MTNNTRINIFTLGLKFNRVERSKKLKNIPVYSIVRITIMLKVCSKRFLRDSFLIAIDSHPTEQNLPKYSSRSLLRSGDFYEQFTVVGCPTLAQFLLDLAIFNEIFLQVQRLSHLCCKHYTPCQTILSLIQRFSRIRLLVMMYCSPFSYWQRELDITN